MSRTRCHNWDMRLYGTAQGWWDPSDTGSRTIATGVSQLNDKSGNARNMTQATGGLQPTVISSAQNGKDALSYAGGTGQNLSVPASTAMFNFLHNGSIGWVFQIFKAGNSASPETEFLSLVNNSGTSGQTGLYLSFNDDGASENAVNLLVTKSVVGQAPISIVAGSAYTSGIYNLFSLFMDADNATASSRASFYINNSLNGTTNSQTHAPTAGDASQNLSLGWSNAANGLGFIGETILYSALNGNYSMPFINNLLNYKWRTY